MPYLIREGRGVSPAVGIVLMIAIVVALGALFGIFATGLELPDDEPTNLAYDAQYIQTGDGNAGNRLYLNVTITAGRERFEDDVYILDSDGNEVSWTDVWTEGPYVESGETLTLDGYDATAGAGDDPLNYACNGEVYRVVSRGDGGTDEIVIQVEIGGTATGPAASYC